MWDDVSVDAVRISATHLSNQLGQGLFSSHNYCSSANVSWCVHFLYRMHLKEWAQLWVDDVIKASTPGNTSCFPGRECKRLYYVHARSRSKWMTVVLDICGYLVLTLQEMKWRYSWSLFSNAYIPCVIIDFVGEHKILWIIRFNTISKWKWDSQSQEGWGVYRSLKTFSTHKIHISLEFIFLYFFRIFFCQY